MYNYILTVERHDIINEAFLLKVRERILGICFNKSRNASMVHIAKLWVDRRSKMVDAQYRDNSRAPR